jgi:hypothetical protein
MSNVEMIRDSVLRDVEFDTYAELALEWDAKLGSPITEFAELPASLQRAKYVSKGVGTRLYTDAATAASGSNVDGAEAKVGLYTVTLDRDSVLDGRTLQGGRIRQIARHAGQRALGRLVGPEAVAERVHDRYAAAAAVRLRTPPHGELRMRAAGLTAPEGVEPGFIVLRHNTRMLRRLGLVAAAGA